MVNSLINTGLGSPVSLLEINLHEFNLMQGKSAAHLPVISNTVPGELK